MPFLAHGVSLPLHRPICSCEGHVEKSCGVKLGMAAMASLAGEKKETSAAFV